MVLNKLKLNTGISLIEVLIVSAIMLVVFGGLLIGFRYSLELISHSRAKLTALTLANDGMEYIRSLSYNAVGTVSGIPSGLIPQVSTTSLNGIVFTKRVLVEYVDSPADGLAGADSNGIITDYKRAKVTLQWTLRGVTKEVFLVSTIIPKSIETDVGGGTVRVNVFNDAIVPLPGADVRLINTTLVPNIDVTRSADATGVALFGGAPAGADYEVIVTTPGYSIDKTFKATTTMPNPVKFPIAVVESLQSTLTMFIDVLSNVTVTALSSKVTGQMIEPFSGSTGIATSTDTDVSSGELKLAGAPGSYSLSGTAYLLETVPTPLAGWDYLLLEGTETTNTNLLARFYTGTSSPYTLIPDSDLPGNSAGFSIGGISLRSLNQATYPAITLGITLSTNTNNETPRLDAITLGYLTTQAPLANRTAIFTGQKVIGYRADTSAVPKTVISTSTGALGRINLTAIEADAYTVAVTAFDVAEICTPTGLTILPGSTTNLELLFTPDTAHTLRVVAKTTGGAPVIGAQVTLSQGVFSETAITKSCGQVFFDGLTSDPNYTLEVVHTGYTPQSIAPINIDGDVVQNVIF